LKAMRHTIFSVSFYRTAAVASILSALTTLGLILLPSWFESATGFEGRMSRVLDPAYQLRSWIYFAHPFFVAVAALGVAARLRYLASGPAVIGLLAFLLWATIEAAQQAMTLFAFDRWRVEYLAGIDSIRETMALRADLYDAAWNAAYFLILVAFLIGCFCYSLAMRSTDTLGRLVGVLYGAAAVLTIASLCGELGGPSLPSAVMTSAYLLVQPAARVLIGVWLWRNADEHS
jgi:hypothetical protein